MTRSYAAARGVGQDLRFHKKSIALLFLYKDRDTQINKKPTTYAGFTKL
jgi:hypothetical protein